MSRHLVRLNTAVLEFSSAVQAQALGCVAISTPLVALFSLRVLDAVKGAILAEVLLIIVHAYDDLVALPTLALRVLSLEKHNVRHRADEADANVRKHDPMTERIPWLVLRAILQPEALSHRTTGIAYARAPHSPHLTTRRH